MLTALGTCPAAYSSAGRTSRTRTDPSRSRRGRDCLAPPRSRRPYRWACNLVRGCRHLGGDAQLCDRLRREPFPDHLRGRAGRYRHRARVCTTSGGTGGRFIGAGPGGTVRVITADTAGPLRSVRRGGAPRGWLAPCVGPTLGVASLLAAQRQNLVQASLVILTFGIATALPFLVIGALSCEVGLAGGQNPYCSPTWC